LFLLACRERRQRPFTRAEALTFTALTLAALATAGGLAMRAIGP
jgi:hypothetical protein